MNKKGFANIILVLIIVILASAVGYFVLIKRSAPITQQSTTPTPSVTQTPTPQTPTPTLVTETANWKTWKSKFGYSLRYPLETTLTNHHCDAAGEGAKFDENRDCNENISINGNWFKDEYDNPNAEAVVVRVLPTIGESFDQFAHTLIVTDKKSLSPKNQKIGDSLLTKLDGEVQSKTISGKEAREFTFSNVLWTIPPYPGYDGGIEGFKGKTQGLLVNLSMNRVLLVTYPLEFCKGVEAPYQCSHDDRISVYQTIVSTLSF